MKGLFDLNDFVSTCKHHTETEYDHSNKQKDPISLLSSPTLNEIVGEYEDSNYINFNTTDASFNNKANLSLTCHGDKHGEVTLQPEDFYYLS